MRMKQNQRLLKELPDQKQVMQPERRFKYWDSSFISNALNSKVYLFQKGLNEVGGDGGQIAWTAGGVPNPARATTAPTGAKTEEYCNFPCSNGQINQDMEFLPEKIFIGFPAVNDKILNSLNNSFCYIKVELNSNLLWEDLLMHQSQYWGRNSGSFANSGVPSMAQSGIYVNVRRGSDIVLKKGATFLITLDFRSVVGGYSGITFDETDLDASNLNHLRVWGVLLGKKRSAVKYN